MSAPPPPTAPVSPPQKATTRPALRASAIDEAARRIDRVVVRTPLEDAPRLSALTGARVLLKREDLQVVRSYKVRGAYNLMSQLDDGQRASGVVCASAGNHAQGVAYACRALSIQGRIYLPRTTPRQKRDRIRAHGGDLVELIVVGDSFDEAAEYAATDALSTGAALVPPFDDLRTMAGQGTVAREILQQLGRPPDELIVPVGGGGLLGGTAAYLAERAPRVTLVGVEPAGAASLTAALSAGRPVALSATDPFVDGASVRTVGTLPFAAIQAYGITLQVVGGAVCTGMLGLYQNEGIITEPAGALAVTALLEREVTPGSTVVCLVSGGNNDVSRYGEILERSLVHLGLKHYFLVEFPQEPGALRRFLDQVLGPDDDITLFEYVKRNYRETGPALVGIELGAAEGLSALLERMARSAMKCERIDPGSAAFRYLT